MHEPQLQGEGSSLFSSWQDLLWLRDGGSEQSRISLLWSHKQELT